MADSLVSRKENNQAAPMHHSSRKELGELVSNLFSGWLDLPYEHSHFQDLEPKIEMSENENDVTVTAEMPGIDKQDIDLEISADGYLTLSGEKKEEKKQKGKGSYFSEISYGSFRRTIPLPWDLRFDGAEADFKNGVLTVMIPKSQEAKGRKKKISIADKQ